MGENESMSECIAQWLAPPPWLGLWGLGETCGHRRMAPRREGQRPKENSTNPTKPTKTPLSLTSFRQGFCVFSVLSSACP